MAEVLYHPNTGPGSGIDRLLRSPAMQTHMARVGADAASYAERYSRTPGISAQTTTAFGRWCVNIVNSAPDAIGQEYGHGRGRPPQAPLGHVINEFRAQDPHRRKPLLARIFGR